MVEAPTTEDLPKAWPWARLFLITASLSFTLFIVFRLLLQWDAFASLSLMAAMLSLAAALLASLWRLLARFGLWLQLPVVVGLTIVFATATANFITFGLRAKNGEAMANLNKLKKAQIYYHRKHGVYRAAQRAPEPNADGQLLWPDPLEQGSGWADLGWHLVGVRSWCQYEVELEGDGFIARSLCDVDHDGKVGIFEVSQDKPPRRITPLY